jgi:hypothetical protein
LEIIAEYSLRERIGCIQRQDFNQAVPNLEEESKHIVFQVRNAGKKSGAVASEAPQRPGKKNCFYAFARFRCDGNQSHLMQKR